MERIFVSLWMHEMRQAIVGKETGEASRQVFVWRRVMGRGKNRSQSDWGGGRWRWGELRDV